MDTSKKCDVCINVYGKYYQSLVTIKSLLKTNGEYIDRLFVVFEKIQPEGFDADKFVNDIGYDKVTIHTPKYYFGFKNQVRIKFTRKGLKIRRYRGFTKSYNFKKIRRNEDYRLSIRYQYAFEKSNKKYLFLMHNDLLFRAPFLGDFMNYIDDGYLGVGPIGQCWNCPLFSAQVCDGDRAQDLRLTYNEVCSYIDQYPSPRTAKHQIDKRNPLPMPECRLNEWVAMLDLEKCREITIPKGNVMPFGKMGFDIATDFYRETILGGYRFKNICIDPFATHGYFSEGFGNPALFNNDLYSNQEKQAREFLESSEF